MVQYFSVASKGIGTPDYSSPKPLATVPTGEVYTSTDIGELAARLGSIDTFDRRGNVIDLDDFESPILTWHTAASSTGMVRHTSIQAWSGAQSVQLLCGILVDDYAQMNKRFSSLAPGKVGMEVHWRLDNWGGPGNDADYYFRLLHSRVDGTADYHFQIRYDRTLGRWYFLTDKNTEAPILEQSMGDAWQPFKLVIDTTTGKYERVILSAQEIDMSEYGGYVTTPASYNPGEIYTTLRITQRDGLGVGTNYLYMLVDDFLLTQNEPEN